MKRPLFICFAGMFVVAACKKSNINELFNPLVGKWVYFSRSFSIGGSETVDTIKPPVQIVDFLPGGLFIPASSFNFRHYFLPDSARVQFSPSSASPGYVIMRYEVKDDTLTLIPIQPACLEGCSFNFLRKRG